MAVSSHELYLVLRARDEASRVLRSFAGEFATLDKAVAQQAQRQIAAGAALATLGVGIAAAGVAGIGWMNGAANAAMAYNQQAALTVTQLDGVHMSMGQVKALGLEVARTMPVAFEQVQPALYDIFSSIDTNAPGAAKLLRGIGLASVAGSVDMETAGRAIIAVLNAYKLPATQVNHVNDVMFQLVRKGVGTYGQFTSVIGRSIPSAIRAGQSFESLAGMMAFMTRNGMSTAQSSTSAARALDALSNPATVKKFSKWGVALTDAKGKFRPVVDIIADMRKKLDKLSPAARSAKLSELFKGSGGTIQAMRFFNLALNDSNHLLPQLTDSMHNAGGAAAEAYKVMANTPEAKLQLLKNRYEALKVTVGDQLLPVKMKLIEALSKIVDWFNKLSPSTQKNIVLFLAIASVLAVVVGIVLVIAGAFLMMAGAATLAGVALLPVIGVVAAIIAIFALLVVGIYYVITHWNEMGQEIQTAWQWIQNATSTAVNAIVGWITTAWNWIVSTTQTIWGSITSFFSGVWNSITSAVSTGATTVQTIWTTIWTAIVTFFMGIWNGIVSVVTTVWTTIVTAVQTGINFVWNIIVTVATAIITFWAPFWNAFVSVAQAVWGLIVALVQLGIALVQLAIRAGTQAIQAVWNAVWGAIRNTVTAVWNFIRPYVQTAINIVRQSITTGLNAIRSVWNAIWSAVSSFVSARWAQIRSLVTAGINAVRSVVTAGVNAIRAVWNAIWNAISSFVSAQWARIRSVVSGGINNARSTISGGINAIRAIWSAAWNAIVSAVTGAASRVMGAVRGLISRVRGFFSGAGSWLYNAGVQIVTGLANGITNAIGRVTGAIRNITARIRSFLPGSPVKEGPLRSWNNGGAGKRLIGLLASGLRDTTPIDHAMRALSGQVNQKFNAAASVLMTPVVGGGEGPGVPGSGGAGGGFGPYGGPYSPPVAPGYNGPPIKIDVHTKEINPVKHAADLGYEVAGRLGL